MQTFDLNYTQVSCSVGHECKRRVETYSSIDALIEKSIEQFVGMLKITLNKLVVKTQNLDEIGSTTQELANTLELLTMNNEVYNEEIKCLLEELMTLKQDFLRASEPVQQLFNRFVTENNLMREWTTSSRDVQNPSKNYANERGKYLVERLRDSWQHLLRDRATRSLTYNDEQFHTLEKIKIAETGRRIKTLLNEIVKPAILLEAEYLADWYKMVRIFLVKSLESHFNLSFIYFSRPKPSIYKRRSSKRTWRAMRIVCWRREIV